MLNKLCGPTILYLAFSLVHIIIDGLYGRFNRLLIEIVISIIFAFMLQLLCMAGLNIISWILVFIPFILFTYITSIILFVFGLNPKEDNIKYKVEENDKKDKKDEKDEKEEHSHYHIHKSPNIEIEQEQFNIVKPIEGFEKVTNSCEKKPCYGPGDCNIKCKTIK